MLLSFSKQHTKTVTSPPLSVTSPPLFSLLKTCDLPVFIEICYCLSSLRDKLSITSRDVIEILTNCEVDRGCYFVKLLLALFNKSEASVRTTIAAQCVKFIELLHSEQRVWKLYCLVRVAVCSNVYTLAHPLLNILTHYTTNPKSHHFLASLRLICESEMAGELPERIRLLEKALLNIQCCDNSPQTHFQDRFINLKIR